MGETLGLHRDAIRRIALAKLAIVYRDWGFHELPFADFASEPGERRDDARAFIIALVAALLGGIAEAMDENNRAIAAGLARRRRRRQHHAGGKAAPPARAPRGPRGRRP